MGSWKYALSHGMFISNFIFKPKIEKNRIGPKAIIHGLSDFDPTTLVDFMILY